MSQLDKDKAIRVLIVGMSPGIGGVETFVMNYFRHLTDVAFDFVDAWGGIAFATEITERGGKIYPVPRLSKQPMAYYQALKILMSNYSIVHIQMLSAANVLPLMAAKATGVPTVIAHAHNGATPKGFIRPALHQVGRHMIRRGATNLWACSRLAGDWLFGPGLDRKAVRIVTNAIELDTFRFNKSVREQLRKELNIGDEFVIGHVGRFAEQKNHAFLIAIFKEVVALAPQAKLLLIGEGVLAEQIKAQVVSAGLTERVIFTGGVTNPGPYYQAMDAMVMPSLFEGLPITGIEAQAAGLPCYFSTNITRELGIVGETFMSLDGTPSTWAKRILSRGRHHDRSSPQIGEALTAAGYDIKVAALELGTAYAALAKGRKSHG